MQKPLSLCITQVVPQEKVAVMYTKLALTAFITLQVLFTFLYIHKQSWYIQLIYQKQKYEKQKTNLIERKHQLQQELYARKDLRSAKDYAQAQGMQKITRAQIRPVESVST